MVRSGTVVKVILGITLFAVPCGAQSVDVDVGETADIDYAIVGGFLEVHGTANLYTGAYIDYGVYAANGCIINIYGGQIGDGFFVLLYNGEPVPVVTIYGRDFALDGAPLDPSADYFLTGADGFGVLTGTYENGDPIDLLFLSDVPIYLESLDARDAGMTIDIKPGDEQNNINLNSKGVVPVAILTTEQFDAVTIDPATAVFAGASPERWSLEDVDGDGDADVMFHFRTQELDLNPDSTEATMTVLTASLSGIQSMDVSGSGSMVSGTDNVRIVSNKSKK